VGPSLSVEEIANLGDPVLRNLWITQRYHELAVQLRAAGLEQDATWCAFAVWASKTAGATIRGDELPRSVQDLLDGDATTGLLHRFNHTLGTALEASLERSHLIGAVKEVNQDVASSIAAGNVMVFSELAPLFTVLAEVAPDTSAEGRAKLKSELDNGLHLLDEQDIDTTSVRAAFDAYQRAFDYPEERSTQILAGNILAVSHEQERLQPNIRSALDAAVHQVFQSLATRELAPKKPAHGLHHLFSTLVGEVGSLLEDAWRSALTGLMLRLVTSGETLDLHESVPPLYGSLYPPELADLSGSAAETPFSTWDRTKGSGDPTGAEDWGELPERMNYIVTLFRSRQRHSALFDPPFSSAQLAALADGRLPDEPL
jgi:hypothetical protein